MNFANDDMRRPADYVTKFRKLRHAARKVCITNSIIKVENISGN